MPLKFDQAESETFSLYFVFLVSYLENLDERATVQGKRGQLPEGEVDLKDNLRILHGTEQRLEHVLCLLSAFIDPPVEVV